MSRNAGSLRRLSPFVRSFTLTNIYFPTYCQTFSASRTLRFFSAACRFQRGKDYIPRTQQHSRPKPSYEPEEEPSAELLAFRQECDAIVEANTPVERSRSENQHFSFTRKIHPEYPEPRKRFSRDGQPPWAEKKDSVDGKARRKYSNRSEDSGSYPQSRPNFNSDRSRREYQNRSEESGSYPQSRPGFNSDRPRREYPNRSEDSGNYSPSSRPRFDSDRPKREYSNRSGETVSYSQNKPRFNSDRPRREYPNRSEAHEGARSSYRQRDSVEPPKPFATNTPYNPDRDFEEKKEKPHWLVQKEALREKLGGEAWNPRKRLSPDAMEGIRHLNKTQPGRFTVEVLAEHFKVSAEAVRRILKSKWQPSDEEQEERLRRWDKRGEKIWSNLVELGIKPPKKWREMGVGRATDGEKPRWKTGSRNSVPVNDSFSDPGPDIEDLIPIVDGKMPRRQRSENVPIKDRLGI